MPLEIKDLEKLGVWNPKNGDVVFFQLEKPASQDDFEALIDNLKTEADAIYMNSGARVRFLVLQTGIHFVKIDRTDQAAIECAESCSCCGSTDHSDPGGEDGAA